MNKQPKTISLKEFTKDFTPKQWAIVNEDIKYYDLMNSLRSARKQKGITQADLVVKAGINRTTLSKIESGIQNATIETLSKLAAALDMKLDITLSSI